MASHNDLGALGEQFALEYLLEKNYQILETNWVCGHKEVDIIAKDGDTIVFVEVKTRHSKCLVDPEITVDYYKQRHLIWAANSYVNRYQYDLDVRFDIIAIVVNPNNEKKIEHIVDAFYPSLK
ncbi:MAG: YraN family protein [Bacteroidales bacterium]|nr:YraN family protein [Bacteroidales bacterium]MBR5782545.1 YraN family protein [Bacteroidales bacterium]